MLAPLVVQGRGAWSRVGKDNGSRYYEYIAGKPLDGSSATRDVNYQAVNLGGAALQARVNSYGYTPALVVDGVLGPKSQAGFKWVQGVLRVAPDGQVGPTTAKALWRDYLLWFGAINQVPSSHLFGFMMAESGADPGAVGYTTPSDHGLIQINLNVHTNITVEQAHDPVFCIDYAGARLALARAKFSGKGEDLQVKCSIAQHNSPAAAAAWYATGTAPSTQIALYVEKVLGWAAQF